MPGMASSRLRGATRSAKQRARPRLAPSAAPRAEQSGARVLRRPARREREALALARADAQTPCRPCPVSRVPRDSLAPPTDTGEGRSLLAAADIWDSERPFTIQSKRGHSGERRPRARHRPAKLANYIISNTPREGLSSSKSKIQTIDDCALWHPVRTGLRTFQPISPRGHPCPPHAPHASRGPGSAAPGSGSRLPFRCVLWLAVWPPIPITISPISPYIISGCHILHMQGPPAKQRNTFEVRRLLRAMWMWNVWCVVLGM